MWPVLECPWVRHSSPFPCATHCCTPLPQARTALSSPLTVCSSLLEQSEISPVKAIVDCMEHMPPLTVDVMSYTLVARMSGGDPRLKPNGVTVQDWLQVRALVA